MTVLSKIMNVNGFSLLGFELALLSIMLVKVVQLLYSYFKSKTSLPYVHFPGEKGNNFLAMSKLAESKKIPKLFYAKGFPILPWQKLLIVADFDLMKKLFQKSTFANRLEDLRLKVLLLGYSVISNWSDQCAWISDIRGKLSKLNS